MYGDTITLMRDGKPCVFVRGRQEVHAVLQHEEFGKTWDSEENSGLTQVDYVMNLIQPMLKNTIFNMHGDENFKRRAAFRPLFTGIKTFVPLFAKTTAEELRSWGEGVVDIQDLSHTLLRKNVFAVLCGRVSAKAIESIPVFHEAMEYFVRRYALACHEQDVTPEDDRMMMNLYAAALAIVHDFKAWIVAMSDHDLSRQVRKSMLYLQLQQGHSDAEMAATIVNVMIAAGEAPASALAQTIEELGRNAVVQSKLQEEATSVGDVATNYDGLEYTEKTTTEGLRMFAPATLVQRSALEDTELAGVLIPEGTVVGICVHSVHKNPEDWPEPERFNPERENMDYETSSSFLSFSKGLRGCPGKHLALAILKVSLAMIVQQFEVSAVAGQPASQDCPKVPKMVEWSIDGIPVHLRRWR